MSPRGQHSPTSAVSPPPGGDMFSRNKRASTASSVGDESVGNATIHPDHFDNNQHPSNNNNKLKRNVQEHLRPHAPSPPAGSHTSDNPHMNDTMFEDEQMRTTSPNELESLRNVYQRNVTDVPNDDQDDGGNDEIEEEIGKYKEDDGSDEEEDERNRQQGNTELGDTQKSGYMGNTATSDGDIVKQTWDPNDTNKLPQEGNQNNVIIEISNFTLKESTDVLRRGEIKKLFVSMDFLNYDPSELESANALPKPAANQPAYYYFRKSIKKKD